MGFRRCLASIFFGVLCASLGLAQSPRGSTASARPEPVDGRENWTDYLPPGDAKALVAKQCVACHDLRSTIQQRKSRQAWETVVFDMVARGAPLFVEEADQIVAYLSDAFEPKAPPLVDVNTAGREDLVKLPGVTPTLADRLIAHRTANGPLSSRDQVRTILGLDDRVFEKIKWYMRPGAGAAGR